MILINDKQKRVVATIQARMGSSRLPGKVLMPLADEPALWRLTERLRRSQFIDEVVVATTVEAKDDAIADFCKEWSISFYRGSENDVLDRVLKAAKEFKTDILVEITGDCPLADPQIIDDLCRLYIDCGKDYAANILKRTYPFGFEAQVYAVSVLEEVNKLTQDPHDREHVSLYIYNHPEVFSLENMEAPTDCRWPELGLTLDTKEDYELIKNVFDNLYPSKPHFTCKDILTYIRSNPQLIRNSGVKRKKVSGQIYAD